MSSSENTWAGVEALARKAGAKHASLVAAQWALESGWGEHFSGTWNAFGLKGDGSAKTTTEYVNGKPITVTAEFIDFPDLGTCVQYLVDRWYKDWKGYEGVDRAPDSEAAARLLVKERYATDPAYADKLIELLRKHAPVSGTGASKGGKAAKAPSKKASSVSKPEAVVLRMKALEDTWLKKEPVQATELGDSAKVAAPAGKEYGVAKWEELPADAHVKVTLAAGAGTWYVFQPHWQRGDASGEALARNIDWHDFDCLVTPYLSVGEILQWDKRRIPDPASAATIRLLRTATEFQRVREAWGQPLGVTSFYRPEPINQQVGGVPGSRHVTGEAFDVYPVGRSLESFYEWVRVRWSGGLGDGRNRGFIHLDTRNGGGFVPGAGVRPVAEWPY